MEITLEIMVTFGFLHRIEGYVHQVSGNDEDMGVGKTDKFPHPLEGTVDIGDINQLHVGRRATG
jgi:hypothetical protein